ncbi:uncharacterized protein ACLA_043340 [Aspergillus clavatus NRRL 1]|uniref:Capsule polysaccharide biosynthesis protein n=1 Tax=Aspergillus clavatus (strain ATCC 1007 / CBS 513.65 / DSM 816 / NCTC 3887 / NRRL 1 / QM 1276 / 107) TaxID=344612 RepID=A1C8H8_ASPCL|nr:uncharacterized protein ACLA_043340 [Aspergillus clavatus NRRL 1]EAW13615.1 conserved hypothetical protein [Aspergillus clavatus NRRL 1]
MESILSLASSVWQSASFWRTVAIGFALLNIKNLPFVWHLRVYRYFFQYGYLITPAVEQPARPSSDLVKPRSIFTHAPILELDLNVHKSNSTYFSDLDVSRTALMSSLIMKGAALLETRLHKQQKFGYLHFILGSVYTNFKREIPAYAKYEVQSHIASFDEKWIYIVTYFLKPSRGKKGKKAAPAAVDDEVLRKRLFAVSISKYVLKKGRYTVPPREAFEAAGFTPMSASGAANGAASVNQRKTAGVNWDAQAEWEHLQAEILKGREIVQPFVDQEQKLYDDYLEKMKLPAFA